MSGQAVSNGSYPVASGTMVLFAAVQDTDAFVASVRALRPAAG
jgi:hypothetical protein